MEKEFNMHRDELGNIHGIDVPEYNIINEDDDTLVSDLKKKKQQEVLKEKLKNSNQ